MIISVLQFDMARFCSPSSAAESRTEVAHSPLSPAIRELHSSSESTVLVRTSVSRVSTAATSVQQPSLRSGSWVLRQAESTRQDITPGSAGIARHTHRHRP